eukprot:Polyplicarium_translucidae@DN705_c0_g1_i1.p1
MVAPKENSKAVAARERKAAAAAEKKGREEERIEDEKWKDAETASKLKKKADLHAKKEEKLSKKQEAQRLLEEEEERDAVSNKKVAAPPPKLTRAEIARRALLASAAQPKKENAIEDEAIPENPNIALREELQAEAGGAALYARGLDEALQKLTVTEADRHPEKRRKAAFKAYEDEWIPKLRAEQPSLKLSQVKQIIFKQWQKAPENPANQS